MLQVNGPLPNGQGHDLKASGIPFKPGVSIAGHYNILSCMHTSSRHNIYAGLDTLLHRKVALKFFSTGADAGDRIRNAQAIANLTHPNIVSVYEVGSHLDQTYVAMEFVDG